MEKWNTELDQLFAKYKDAVPDPDASANFMPGLWQKIEARQSFTMRIKKLTQVFVVATAAVCLGLGMAVVVPSLHQICAAPTWTFWPTPIRPIISQP